MDTDTRGEPMIQGLAFEVEAIPQEDTIHVRSPANMTPITVKIRVRKREDGGLQKGLISVPKFGPIDCDHERIRLVSSDQTIMSFNMLMEADLERKPLRKPRRRFFGGCLGTQADDDDGPYVPATIDTRESKSETGMVNTKLMLADTGDDYDTYVMARKDKKFFGSKCKPGGCLDPPFNEEKYPYLPTPMKQTLRTQNEKLLIIESPEEKKIQAQSPVLTKVVPRWLKKSSDSSSIKTSDKEDPDDSSILSLYKVDATKATLDENESDHIITYPAELSSSEQRIDDERRRHSRNSSTSKSRKSFNEINTPYFSPKRDAIKSSSRENSSDRNISLLRKGITKDKVKVLADKENTRQGRTISNVTQDKMVPAANVLPHILRTADYIEPLIRFTNSNEEADVSFNKKTSIKLEDDVSEEEQKELSGNLNKDDNTRERVAMRGHPQTPKIGTQNKSDMDADHTSNASVTDNTQERVAVRGRPQIPKLGAQNISDMDADHTSDASVTDNTRERVAMRGRPQMPKLGAQNISDMDADHTSEASATDKKATDENKTDPIKSDLSHEFILSPSNIKDGIESKSKIKKETNVFIVEPSSKLPVDSFANDPSIQPQNLETSSVNNHQDDSTGKPNGSTNDDKQSKKKNEQMDPYSGNITGALRSGPNYRKPSSLVGKDKYTMDVEPGDRKSNEEMSPKKHSLASNISDNKVKQFNKEYEKNKTHSPTNSLVSSDPYYRKQTNLKGQDKSRKYSESGSRDERRNSSSLVANGADLYSYGSPGPFYRGSKQSSLVEKDKFTEVAKSGSNDEGTEIKQKNGSLLGDTFESKDKLKNEDKNFEPKKPITASEGTRSQDRKNSDDTENVNKNEIQSYNASLQKTTEMTQKLSPEILSAVALSKVQRYGDTEQSEIGVEPTFGFRKKKENDQDTNETQHSQDKDFEKQEFENAPQETMMELRAHENADELQNLNSVKRNAEENADKKESHGLTKEKMARMSSDSLPKTLPGTSSDEHIDILDQIKKLKTNAAASEGEDINEEIRKKLPANVDINDIIDTPNSQLNITSEGLSKNIIVTNSGTEIQISPKDVIKKIISKETLPSSKNKIDEDKIGQQQTSDGVFFGSKTSFSTRTKLQDTHNISINMKETGSNESLHNVELSFKTADFTGLQDLTVSEKSDEYTELDIQKTPMKMNDAKYFDKISQGQQKQRTSHQEGIITKPTISSLIKDSVMLDFAFTSFLNDKDEKVVKTLESSSVDTQTMNNVVVVKTAVKSDSKDLRIPIDYNNYMSIKIKKARKESDPNKSDPTSLEHLTSEEASPKLDVGAHASPSKFEADVTFDNKGAATPIKPTEPRSKKGIDSNVQESMQRNRLQETLSSIYERELIPLQNTIKGLQGDIDVLAEQQIKFRDTVQGVKMIRPTRLIHSTKRCDVIKRCGCIHK